MSNSCEEGSGWIPVIPDVVRMTIHGTPMVYVSSGPLAEFFRLAEMMIGGSLLTQDENRQAYREARDRAKEILDTAGGTAVGDCCCGEMEFHFEIG